MTRLENIILYLLTRAKQKGKDNLSKFELFKLLYLLEVESYRFTGESFFDLINFVRDRNGPIPLNVYNSLDSLDGKYIKVQELKKSDYPFARHCISLKKNINKFDLKDSEKIFINSVVNSYLDLSQKKMKEVVYNTEPMREVLEQEKKQKSGVLKGRKINFNTIPLDEDMVDLLAV